MWLVVVGVLAVVLKLAGVVDWSWPATLTPLWLMIAWFIVRALFSGVSDDWKSGGGK